MTEKETAASSSSSSKSGESKSGASSKPAAKKNVAAEATVPETGKEAKTDKQGRPETHDSYGETHDDGGIE